MEECLLEQGNLQKRGGICAGLLGMSGLLSRQIKFIPSRARCEGSDMEAVLGKEKSWMGARSTDGARKRK